MTGAIGLVIAGAPTGCGRFTCGYCGYTDLQWVLDGFALWINRLCEVLGYWFTGFMMSSPGATGIAIGSCRPEFSGLNLGC